MLRRPPRSTRTDTLLPYTTLFRSCHSVATRGAVRKACRGCNPDLRLPPLPQGFRCVAVAVVRHRKIKSSSLRSRPHPPSGHLAPRSEEHTSELQSLMRISYAVFCLKQIKTITAHTGGVSPFN